MLKSSAAGPPAVPAMTPRTTITATAAARLRFQWWVRVRARRARGEDTRREGARVQTCGRCSIALRYCSSGMTEPAGLRERKKQQTREAIVRAALALFAERGFEATTIADIAAAADIAPRTFFGYFASKEDVVFHDFDEVFAAFSGRVLERPPGEPAFDAMRDWLTELIASRRHLDEDALCRRRLVRATPALQAHDRSNLARFRALLSDAVAVDLGVPAGSLRPHLVSAAAVAAIESLGRFEDDDRAAEPELALAVLDEALVFLAGGMEALRRHPPVVLPD